MSDDFYKRIDSVDVHKVNWLKEEERERGIRLYCSTSHGTKSTFNLQVRGPITVGEGRDRRDGRDFVVATAGLSVADMKALRAEIDAQLAEISPRRRPNRRKR